MKRLVWGGILLSALVPAAAQTPIQLGMATSAEAVIGPSLSSRETVGISGRSSLFEAAAQLEINSDGKYGADIANFSASKNFFDNYFVLKEGFVAARFNPVELQVGRYAQVDEFDSPYSLFLNPARHSAFGMRIRYEDSHFAYESRWVELNHRSHFSGSDVPEAWRAQGGFPDRGASLKTFLFKFGALKVGLQDAGVYTGRSFDAEYFISPMPAYFTQYVKNTAGRPWSTGGNENNLLGFFVDWTQPNYSLGMQVLFDDFSLHFLFPEQVPNNPWKAAWTFGGRFKTDIGQFGIFQAGALRYTFAPITTGAGQEVESAYGYTYYPDVEYSVGGGKFRALDIEDNALGYQYGENNLAVRVTYDKVFGRSVTWKAYLEGVIAGQNSPANPWHDATGSEDAGGTRWLDDPVLQRSLIWFNSLTWDIGSWQLFGTCRLGYIGNLFTLRSPAPSQGSTLDRFVKIFEPSNHGEAVATLVLGFRWNLDVSALQRRVSGTP